MYILAFREFGGIRGERVIIGRKRKDKSSSFGDVGNLPHNDVAPFSLGEDGLDLGGFSCVFLRLVIFSISCGETLYNEWKRRTRKHQSSTKQASQSLVIGTIYIASLDA